MLPWGKRRFQRARRFKGLDNAENRRSELAQKVTQASNWRVHADRFQLSRRINLRSSTREQESAEE